MSEAALKEPVMQSVKPTIKMLQSPIRGRVESYERNSDTGFFYTVVKCPAADEFSSPSVFRVRSKFKIGDKLDMVSGLIQLSGSTGKSYTYTDRQTGEVKTGFNFPIFLDWIE